MAQGCNEELVVRRAGPSDVTALWMLNREVQALHAAAEPQVFKPIVADAAPFAALVADAEVTVLLAELAGEPVGYCATRLIRRPENAFTYPVTMLYVDQIAVRQEHRRHGVGAALLARANDLAADVGATQLALDVWSFNDRAQRFFAHQGFATFNERMRRRVSESVSR